MSQPRNRRSIWRSLAIFFAALVILVVYAYGLQVTKVDLEKPKEARRQAQLTNIIRGLARPRLFEYEEKRLEIDAPLMMPCNDQVVLPPVDTSGRYIELTPNCVALGGRVTVNGYNFEPGETVFLYFLPRAASIHEQVELRLADAPIEVNPQGQFTYVAEMRKDRPSDEPQAIRAVVKMRSGLPHPSDTLKDTWDKIVETVFLALIATTLGTALAIPISFLGARNLMSNVVSPFGSIMTGLLLAPVGGVVGFRLFSWLKGLGGGLGQRAWPGLGALMVSIAVVWALILLLSRQTRGRFAALRQGGLGLLAALLAVFALGLLATLGIRLGLGLQEVLGPFAFLGNLIFVIADLLAIILPLLGGLMGLFLFVSLGSSLSGRFLRSTRPTTAKAFTAIAATLAGAVLAALLLGGIAWLYEVENPVRFVAVPAAAVGAIMLVISLLVDVQRPVPTGMIVYNITRTILNALRSIEPLIMVVAFAVWVGIGPFAGVMALALHTIAGLGKLYSEQVENILEGPIEAVTATGANRLQTIVYAVIPQIVPPYIAFTIYRWDINVRMSTIIGFGGGGGIGFLVQQNLNLLKYRDASVQMIAIAIVVATLDYASAKVRERIV
ncbi:MAG: ABC transporter permease subunit [Anaerolineae bacterium]|nr:ABC transporter permease subunit [Anaerolineae bacterium]